MAMGSSKKNGSGPQRWRGLFGWIGAVTGLLGAGPGEAASAPTAAPLSDYRAAAAAPAAWQVFAKQLQSRFQERLAAEDDLAERLQEALAKRDTASNGAVTVRAWIRPTGQIERVEFDPLEALVAARLRVALGSAQVDPPPADMLQPVHVRLVLRPNDQSVH
jgi:hypothetical protein